MQRINTASLERFVAHIRDKLWVLQEKRIAVWGLAFKANTDDVRSSLAVELVRRLVAEGARVAAYDPKAMETGRAASGMDAVEFCASPLEAAVGADALVIATEWPEFAAQDFGELKVRMRTAIIFDGRNLLDPPSMRHLGFEYMSIGRP